MNLHEYQAKNILRKHGMDMLTGYVAYTPEEAANKIHLLSGNKWVVKAQVQAGGRGKSGGIKFVSSEQEVALVAQKLIGSTLKTPQTPDQGLLVRKVYVEEVCDIDKEFYLSFSIARDTGKILLMISPRGGVHIEEVGKDRPDLIQKYLIDPSVGLWPHHIRDICYGFSLSYSMIPLIQRTLTQLYNIFINIDAEMIEINPLVLTPDAKIYPLDAKITIDDNALFRQPELETMRDLDNVSEIEAESKRLGFSYTKLNGNVGCMVNGAGLALATLDLLKHHNIAPANFLDIGGGATQERVVSAFRLLLADPQVDCILINIFGGITRCDVLAKGIIHVLNEIRISVPLVVRLQGTKVKEGRQILQESTVKIDTIETLDEAAKAVTRCLERL